MKFFRDSALALAAILGFAIIATAQTSPSAFENIKIGNFGQMDENYYRGAQPLPDDYKSLADLGIKTIIDLRNDPTDYEKTGAEAVGIKYINIPMSGWQKPSDADIAKFLEIANDPATGKFFVHCKAGIHRTGMTGAIYRMTKEGWNYDKAYAEMKNYNFSSGLVHGGLKSYVKKYAGRLESQKAAAASVPSDATRAGAPATSN
jgi:protein tyrosine/serine phosphatase